MLDACMHSHPAVGRLRIHRPKTLPQPPQRRPGSAAGRPAPWQLAGAGPAARALPAGWQLKPLPSSGSSPAVPVPAGSFESIIVICRVCLQGCGGVSGCYTAVHGHAELVWAPSDCGVCVRSGLGDHVCPECSRAWGHELNIQCSTAHHLTWRIKL